ncbi:MAG: hypothetical protein ACOH2L_04885 [Devosia sp.]
MCSRICGCTDHSFAWAPCQNHVRAPNDDDVCVAVLVPDAAGNNIVAHHQNGHSLHGAVMQGEFTYRSRPLASARSIELGSRQCRRGPHQDDGLYAAVVAGIAP